MNNSKVNVSDASYSLKANDYMEYRNTMGYVMLEDAYVNVQTGFPVGNIMFSGVNILHGRPDADKSASYAYVMLPGSTSTTTAEFAKDPSVEILYSGSACHAVKDLSTGKVFANVFLAPVDLEGITVLTPCSIIIENGGKNVYVSDPTQMKEYIELSFHGNATVLPTPSVTVAEGGKVTVDVSETKGATYKITVE